SRVETHRTSLPSGLHLGDSSKPLCGMSVLSSLPSAAQTWMLSLPSVPSSLSETYTTRLPSAEKWPSKCGSLCSGKRRFISPSAASIVHRAIFPWWMRVNSSVLPSGDHWRCCLKLPSELNRRISPQRHEVGTKATQRRQKRLFRIISLLFVALCAILVSLWSNASEQCSAHAGAGSRAEAGALPAG